MKPKTLISALRAGRSLENPTPYKWFGLACSVGGLVLVSLSGLAAAQGWIDAALSLSDAVLISSLVLGSLFAVSAHSQVTTTDKIGLLPRGGDPALERVQFNRVADLPAGADAPVGSRCPENSRDQSDSGFFGGGGLDGFNGG